MSQTIETLWSLDVSIPLFHMVNAILRGHDCDARAESRAHCSNLSTLAVHAIDSP